MRLGKMLVDGGASRPLLDRILHQYPVAFDTSSCSGTTSRCDG